MMSRLRLAAALALVGALPTAAAPGADLRPELTDHSPPPLADRAELPEALHDMLLPRGGLDRLTEVYAAADGAVRSVRVAWLSGDRYLWRIHLAEPITDESGVTLYLDADADPETGRPDARGTDVMLQIWADHTRRSEWMADGTLGTARSLHTAVDGATVWFSYDHAMRMTPGGARCIFWLTWAGGATDPIKAELPAHGPRPISLEDGREVGGGLRLSTDYHDGDGDGLSLALEVANEGDGERWIDLRVPFTLPFGDGVRWFDGFNFTPHDVAGVPLGYHGTSAVLPLTCAWDGETGIALALDPMDMYTELHSGVRRNERGELELTLGSRLALMPGEVESFEFLAFRFDGSLGWRGAFARYWEMFPEVYERARDIDPRFHMASAGGLYRSWSDPGAEEFASDLIRRMGGHWEWGYAPAPRPGEWAVSELSVGEWTRSRGTVKKSLTAESLPEVQERIRGWVRDGAELADVAVAYYMHLKNCEKGLVEQHWPDSYFQNEPIEYMGYYQFVPCWLVYPWANSYGEYMREAIPTIAERFEPAGMAFDSVFGSIPHWGPSADRSPATTFDNGRAFVGEGIGFAKQMDVCRAQHTGGYRTAMVTNLKLPTISADAVRTDAALIEHHPMNNPGYRERFLRLRMLSGRIMFNWWHTYDPKYYTWIPWDELNAQQTIDALRRLRDDLLIHSLYYGAVPNARFAAGVPKLMRALPMLTEIADLGWEPVIGAEAGGGELPVSRFGDGLGMAFGVCNQSYDSAATWLTPDWELVSAGHRLIFATWGDEPTRNGTGAVAVAVPARGVKALRAVLSLPPRGGEVVVLSANALPLDQSAKHQPGGYEFTLGWAADEQVDIGIWLPEHATMPVLGPVERVVSAQRVGEGPLQARVRLQQGENTLTVSWQPKVPLQGDRQALLNFPFVTDGRPNCNVVACGDTRDLAFRVQEYFREYHRWALDGPQTVKLPIVTPDQAPAGRRVVVGLLDDLPEGIEVDLGDAAAAFGVQGDVVYATAETPEMLERAVEGLLFTLDEKYEYWGPFYPTQHFFRGDPSKCAQALQDAGMAGKLLTGEDTGSLREVIDLPDLIEWP